MERAIVEALKSAYGNRNVKFQVVIQNRQLDIYFNHRRDDRPNYLLLEETVAAAIASLDLAAIDGVRLYCRPQGQVTPDWQTSIEFKLGVNTDDIETIGTTESQIIADNLSTIELSSASTTENYPIDPIASDPNAITDLEVQTEWERKFVPEDDSTSFDTGLLHHAGLTHSSNLEETEIDSDSVLDAIELQAGVFSPAPDNELARYCFVSNRQLLTSDIIDPGKEIVRLVKFFHHLGDRSQFKLLPILTTYFQQGTTNDLDCSPAVQKWFQQIKELNYDDQQMLAIWLSRYCFSPDATLEEFKAIDARQAEKAKRKQANYRAQAYSYIPATSKDRRSQLSDAPSKPSGKFSVKKLLLPTAWVLATVILLAVAIADRVPSSTMAERIPTLCQNTIGSPDYCRLAVNLAGTKAIARSPQSPYPLTQLTETVATYGCQRYANLKAEIAPDLTLEQAPAIGYGEKVFPHIYVVRVEQKNAQKEGSTQVGCVYTTGRGQRSPELLAADVIPTNWPTEPYQNEIDANFGGYTLPLSFGLHTIFAAIAIAIASWLNLGLKVNRAATIYLAALVLGLTQLLAAAVPIFSSLAKVILPVFAIFALNQSLKGFRISDKSGIAAIAIGILTVVLVQLVLYGFCLSAINSLL